MNGILPEGRFLLAAKESSQRKLPLFRRSGPATWGLHAPKTPKKEVARPFGYANAVLLFALNANGPSSTFESGVPPNPRFRLRSAMIPGPFGASVFTIAP